MLTTPRVDVLVPVFNTAETIEGSLASILHQTVTDLRLIVVDDGSTDATAAVVRRMAHADSRVMLIEAPHGGIVDALNIGLGACTAPYIARHDADDIAFPLRLAVQLAYLDEHPDCIATGANAWHIDKDGHRIGTRTTFAGDVAPDDAMVPAHEPYLMHPLLVARRAVLQAVGGYRHAFHAEDSDLYWRLLEHGRLHNLAEILGEYRLHRNSISGASALNGRISAANSQLAALSHRRRAAGRPDIEFPREALAAYERAGTLAAIVAVASTGLDAGERSHLQVASALKLLWLSEIRAYSLSDEDHRTIAQWLEQRWPDLPAAQRASVSWHWSRAVAHRLARCEWREAVTLAGRPIRFARLIGYSARAALARRLRHTA